MTLLPHRCFFCKTWSRELNCFLQGDIYIGSTDYYHQDCFKRVLNNPEIYGHRTVDMALKITEQITFENENKQQEELKYKKGIEKLKQFKIK